MAIKVYGNPISAGVLRILASLNEKGLDYELIPVDMKGGEHKREPFISLNPFGQIPAFADGDFTLFESRAITSYVANNYADKGTPLLSSDPKKKAIDIVWTEVESQQFDPIAYKLNYELAIKKVFGLVTDDALVAELEEKLAKVLDVYERRLSQTKYLAGDHFSLTEVNHLPLIHNLTNTKLKALFDARPHVNAWAADILARPSWAKVKELL